MSPSSLRFIVVLGDPAPSRSKMPGVVCHCASAAEADALLDGDTPEVLVIDGRVSWHVAVAERARHKGSAIIATGPLPPPGALADEWVRSAAEEPDLEARVELALARAHARTRVVRRSCTDTLTGLPNRRELLRSAMQLAARTQRTGESLALVLLDLDQFKAVNDRFGHPEGDRLLRHVGTVLRREVRKGETCGRIGGDEFAVVLTGGFPEAHLARDRLVAALRQAGVSVTGGVAVSRGGRRLRQLYGDADAALLKEKRTRQPMRGRPQLLSRHKEVESNNQLIVA